MHHRQNQGLWFNIPLDDPTVRGKTQAAGLTKHTKKFISNAGFILI